MNAEEFTCPAETLRSFVVDTFAFFGVPEADAEQAADVLVTADLRGIDSHGVARLHTYARFLADGQINPRPNIRIVRETETTATIDGDRGLGLVVGPWANRLAMEKAQAHGAGWVAVQQSNHFGIAGYYPMQALEHDLIGWAMTNAGNLVAPFRGAERMLGTNPLAIAFPGLEEPPIVIDMATSAVAYGKVQLARREDRRLSPGLAIDRNGQMTVDPEAMANGGALLPLGSDAEGGGHKGYCLGAMVDILCGVLAGAGWGPFAPQFALRHPKADSDGGTGHFFGALRLDGFIEPEVFKRQIDDWIRTLRATRPAPGTQGPLVPGDPERWTVQKRSREGIPLARTTWANLVELAGVIGVPWGVSTPP